MIGRVSRACTAVVAAAVVTLGLPAVAHADSTVVVHGTEFTDPWAQLAYVGCTDVFTRDEQVLAPTIGFGPGRAPSGARSLGYDLAGGTAVGSQHIVASLADTTTASLAVSAPAGSTGRAVVGYQESADSGTSLMWFGVAPLSVPAGGWTSVEATSLSYTWTKYDMSTRAPLLAFDPVTAEPRAFLGAHGSDGPGLYAITFGCDGNPFSMDAMRIGTRQRGVTTYDLEGLATALTIAASQAAVNAGDPVTVHGALYTSGSVPIPHATVILERRTDSGTWENIRVVPVGDGDPVAKITPTRTALYRWRFVDRPLAEGSTSAPFFIVVLPQGHPLPDPSPSTETPPAPDVPPSAEPTPTSPATDEVSATP